MNIESNLVYHEYNHANAHKFKSWTQISYKAHKSIIRHDFTKNLPLICSHDFTPLLTPFQPLFKPCFHLIVARICASLSPNSTQGSRLIDQIMHIAASIMETGRSNTIILLLGLCFQLEFRKHTIISHTNHGSMH